MNTRLLAVAAALLAPLATIAQDQSAQPGAPAPAQPASPTPAQPAAPDAQPAPAETPDASALQGKIESLAEQYAETKNDVAGLKRLKLSGYVQGRWAWQESAVYEPKCATPGACTADEIKAYAPPDRDNFYVRRGRLKAVYDASWSQYVLQIDAIPSGISLKEAYAELKLPAGLAVDAGLQLFPMGYEVAVRSSADLDNLERAMIYGALLKGEYDLGVALKGVYGPINFRVGVFNGNGIDAGKGGRDNDQLKDVIGRVGFDLGWLTGGVNGWYGKTIDYTSATNKEYDRVRAGGDLQIYLDLLPFGGTALKGEYLWGKTAIGSGAGGAGDSLGKTMSGWYATLVQNVGGKAQVAVRWDQFDPDHGLDRNAAANASRVFVKQSLDAAVHYYLDESLKLSLAYFHPMNGDKGATAPSDPKADVFMAQLQAKF
jgi:hypothetical protein